MEDNRLLIGIAALVIIAFFYYKPKKKQTKRLNLQPVAEFPQANNGSAMEPLI